MSGLSAGRFCLRPFSCSSLLPCLFHLGSSIADPVQVAIPLVLISRQKRNIRRNGLRNERLQSFGIHGIEMDGALPYKMLSASQ
jgi:hypothetical protein